MYAAYFGLKREPFSIAPDPHYLFMSERHREALAHLLYGLGGGGGFVLLTGEIGTGKTTLCRLFLEQIPKNCNVAYIFNPKLTVIELLQSVCDEFHVEVPRRDQSPTVKDYLDPLNAFLLASHADGRNNVLIIDEAQNLAPEVLEQLRLLTNLETRERKLLQVILIGQPELRQMLARPDLEQLAQRVIARYHLDALTPPETEQYIRHRLDVAGLDRPFPFEARAVRRIHAITRGVPRRINLLCDRALLGAFATSRASVDAKTVDKAAGEVFDMPPAPPVWRQPAFAVLVLGLLGAAGLWAASRMADEPVMAKAPVKPAPKAAAPASPASAIVPVVAVAPPRPVEPLADLNVAWRELASAWKAEAGEVDPCTTLAKQQLQCFSRPMSLAAIRELDRPGILKLDAEQGTPRYVLLTGLSRDSATIRAGGIEQTVTLASLAARWQGDYATLWRSPPGFNSRGTSGETVDWIAARLASAASAPAPATPVAWDAALRQRLRAFQLAHGLPGDGQPGPMTYMQLQRAGGSEEPRLRGNS